MHDNGVMHELRALTPPPTKQSIRGSRTPTRLRMCHLERLFDPGLSNSHP